MSEFDAAKRAGSVLKRLIKENYASQEDFAYDYGIEVRTVSRYVNNGITKVDVIQSLAAFFHIEFVDFFKA